MRLEPARLDRALADALILPYIYMRCLSLHALPGGAVRRPAASRQNANIHAVQLEWNGAAGPVAVERTNGTTWQKIAAAAQANYEDSAIDPFATYRYRVSANGKSSNEVIVGPPPAGVLNTAPSPKETEPPKYGPASAIARSMRTAIR